MNLYRGFIPLSGKKATMSFKDKETSDLLTLEEVQKFNGYAGVLDNNTVLVDIDDFEQSIFYPYIEFMGKCIMR